MKKVIAIALLASHCISAQNVAQKMDQAVKDLMKSTAAYSANLSVYVADANGNFVYEYQGNKGLSSASTQKIFSAASALETLGKDYRYTTSASYTGSVNNGELNGDLHLFSNGDPTLGSWRYDGYKPENFKAKLLEAIQQTGIKSIAGNLVIDDSYFDFQNVPGGWPWDDMGNYYGAGVWGVNWRENQFDLKMMGNSVQNTNIELPNLKWVSEVKAAGNSDQSLIFTAPYSDVALINGSLPAGKTMTVSGSTPNPPLALGYEIRQWLKESKIDFNGEILTASGEKTKGKSIQSFSKTNLFFEYKSPSLDQIVYWFMRKSVNLYGETFVKTMAKSKSNEGSFPAGIKYMKSFWVDKGINSAMINFADGSGLSPQNYVSARAEVQALLWSKKQDWYPTFLESFPTQNGMKMKSGTMKNTKSFAGYHNNYVYAILINNYQGGNVSEALFKVLNTLK